MRSSHNPLVSVTINPFIMQSKLCPLSVILMYSPLRMVVTIPWGDALGIDVRLYRHFLDNVFLRCHGPSASQQDNVLLLILHVYIFPLYDLLHGGADCRWVLCGGVHPPLG